MPSIREYRLFLGNPGTGKSTLINCLLGRNHFPSGLSWGGGLTQDYHRFEANGIAYVDTPGLADTAIADKAASAITKALKENGNYKLLFVTRILNGRVVSEDLVTLERVLFAINMDPRSIRFSVLLNMVDASQFAALMEPGSAALESVRRVVNSRQFQTDAFCVIPEITELEEASDTIATLPQHVLDFIEKRAPIMYINPQSVIAVDPKGFEEHARRMRLEMEKLLVARTEMLALIPPHQKTRSRRAQRGNGGDLSTPMLPLHSLHDDDSKQTSIATRKKALVAIIVGVVVVAVVIVVSVVATSGSDGNLTEQPTNTPSPVPNHEQNDPRGGLSGSSSWSGTSSGGSQNIAPQNGNSSDSQQIPSTGPTPSDPSKSQDIT